MKRNYLVLAVSLLALGLTACGNNTKKADEHNAKNSLDWFGTYVGVVPCADCEGIKVTIIVDTTGNYTKEAFYLGKGLAHNEMGVIEWDATGNQITLVPEREENAKSQLKVSENKLTMLDLEGKEIVGELADNYVLTKRNYIQVEGLQKYWKLVELMGQPVEYKGEGGKEAHMRLDANGNVHGNFSCNGFAGGYKVEEGYRISFTQMASTMMMCLNMDTERKFSEVLTMTDNYNLNGDTLILNKARMAPLARFVAVYM